MPLTIKVLGPGCANCNKVEELAVKAVEQMGVEAELIKVKRPSEWADYGLLRTPGLVINEKLVCSGRIPTLAEITTWLADAQS
jgi:small redox-active disulfide protein 2